MQMDLSVCTRFLFKDVLHVTNCSTSQTIEHNRLTYGGRVRLKQTQQYSRHTDGVHVYIRTYIHTYILTYIHIYIHTYIYTYIH